MRTHRIWQKRLYMLLQLLLIQHELTGTPRE
jgi:hypothetical protein